MRLARRADRVEEDAECAIYRPMGELIDRVDEDGK